MAEVSASFAADKRKINVGFRSVKIQKENRQLLALIRNKTPVPTAVTRQQAPPRQPEIGWQAEVRQKLYRPDCSDRTRVWSLPALCKRAKSRLLPPGGVPDPSQPASFSRVCLHSAAPPRLGASRGVSHGKPNTSMRRAPGVVCPLFQRMGNKVHGKVFGWCKGIRESDQIWPCQARVPASWKLVMEARKQRKHPSG